MSDNTTNSAAMKIQLSPTPQPSPSEKNPKKPRKKVDPLVAEQEAAKNVLFEKLMNDPLKKRMVIQLLHDNKAVIQEYQRIEGGAASPINKLKNAPKFESPTALMKRRLLEKQKKQQQVLASNALELEKGMQAITPSRKPVKKTLLKGVVAYVEVKDLNNVDKSEGVKGLLMKMGAAITNIMTHATHVIYKDGRYETYKRAKALKLPVVSILWLDVMDRTGMRVPCDMYPALGDYQSIKACNELVEKLENNGKPTTSRRKTLVPSHTFDIDDDLLATMKEFSDSSSEIIEDSQPEPSCTSLMGKLKNATLRAQTDKDAYASDESESSAVSGTSGASSVTPIIAGQPAGRTRSELNASNRLNESLIGSPFINKNKRTAVNLTFDNCEDDKENSPIKKPSKPRSSQGMFKQITQRKARFGMSEPEDNVFESSPNGSPAKESPLASTPNVTRRTRRTLLPPELLGIVTEETNVSAISMELTNQGGLNERSKNNGDKKVKGRKTNVSQVSMEITRNLETNPGEKTDQENNENVGVTENVGRINKKINDSNITINGPENENDDASKTIISKSINRASTSSTSTTKSDDLSVYTVKRRTRQSVLLTTPNKQNSSLDKDTNASLAKLSLRISDGTEQIDKTKKSDEVNLSAAKTRKNDDESRNNLSITSNSGSVSRRITRRMSTQIRLNESEVTETDVAKQRDSSGVDLSLKLSENSRGSSVPSLRLSSEGEKSKTSNASNAAGTNVDVADSSKSDSKTNAIDTPAVPVTNGDTSPITNISRRLFNTSITQSNKPGTTSASADASMLSRSCRTHETASTSFSIVDNSDESRDKDNVTRSRSGRASVISDVPTSASRGSRSKNVAKSAETTQTTATTATSKRKLCNPDDLLEDDRGDDDEERKQRTEDVQSQRDPVSRRKALQDKLDALTMPTQATQDIAPPRRVSDCDDFQDGVCSTQKSQPLPTQPSSAMRRRNIVCTRFHNAQIERFKAIVGELGDFQVDQNVNGKTTHLVAMEASRTLNFLRAMSRGIWILRAEWLFDSHKAGKWLDEDAYEMIEFSPFVQQHRLQREAFGKSFCHDVFAACGKMLVSETCHPSRRDLIDLIRLCKGEVTNDVDDAAIVIGGCPVEQKESQTQVKEAWILDSITFGRCKKMASYLILNSEASY